MTDSVTKSTITRPTHFARDNPRVDVIFNVVSGTRDPDVDLSLVRTSLEKSFENIVVWKTTPEKAGEELGREAIADGARVLVACGGDGTVAGVAAAVQDAEVDITESSKSPVLGVVPRGTANALCVALDIPLQVSQAADMIASGHVRKIDFPQVEHTSDEVPSSMLLLCGIGFEANAIKRADRGMKRALGMVAYAIAGLVTTVKQPCFTADISLYDVEDSLMFAEGQFKSKEMHLENLQLKGVTVANVAPATSVLAQGIGNVAPDDGLLEVVFVASNSPLGLIRIMLSMLRSALMRTREKRGKVYGLRAKKVAITCDPPQRIVIDGEPMGKTPITIELTPEMKQVQVIAPKAGVVNRRRRRFGRALTRFWRNVRGAAVLAVTIALMRRSRLDTRNRRLTS